MINDFFAHSLPGFTIQEVSQSDHIILIVARSLATVADCPDCHTPSSRVHSRYQRCLADLPWSGQRVQLHLLLHRFFCINKACHRRTFAEPISDLASRFARRTNRLTLIFVQLALALGGEAGTRLASLLALPCSPATILRSIRHLPLSSSSVLAPRVIGIDDWAWRKGQRYGTIICDLQAQRPIELLRDRTIPSTADWLQRHPSVEVISRDRGGVYAEAARLGAPQAIQVADRWHLLQNFGDALELLLTHHLTAYRRRLTHEMESTPMPSAPQVKPLSLSDPYKNEQRRQARLARYEQVVARAKQGMTTNRIARAMDMSMTTVEKWLAAGHFPERQQRAAPPRPTPAWFPYALKRWHEGKSILAIHHELQAQGDQGTDWSVYTYLTTLRKAAQTLPPTLPAMPLSAQKARWLFLRRPGDLTQEQQTSLHLLQEGDPELERVYELTQGFVQMIRTHTAEPLQRWLQNVEVGPFTELHTFARGIRQDQAAVTAGLSLPWSHDYVA
jgi:Transposase and inactivated derivatives